MSLETELGWEIDEVLVKVVRDAHSVQTTYSCLEDSDEACGTARPSGTPASRIGSLAESTRPDRLG